MSHDQAPEKKHSKALCMRRRYAYLFIMSVLILTLIGLGKVFYSWLNMQSINTPQFAGSNKIGSFIVSAAALTGISMEIEGEVTHLHLFLTQDVFYQVSTDLIQHSILIKLKNAHLATNITPADNVNSALSNVEATSVDDNDVNVMLIIKPNARLRNLELKRNKKLPEIQIDFVMKKDSVTVPAFRGSTDDLFSRLKKLPTDMFPIDMSKIQFGKSLSFNDRHRYIRH